MTDIDQIARRLSDLETIVKEQGYRIKALEKDVGRQFWNRVNAGKTVETSPGVFTSVTVKNCTFEQFCPCGRDVCRAPECPSHKTERLAPDGYSKLPTGDRCKCVQEWRDKNGDHWCCCSAKTDPMGR